ncbi:MAG: hypothetical protein GY895_00530 [Phycisphaera sp.]|nr:hypothetical protein [Phycisphaera sp.]
MNHANTTLRLAATTLAAALATTAVGESKGASSSESGRADGGNAMQLETGIRTGGHLVANHPEVRVQSRPSLDSSRRGTRFQTARPKRNQTGGNPLDLLELIESELAFTVDDLDSADGPGRTHEGRPLELAEIHEWTADDLDSANGPRQPYEGRPLELAEPEQQRLQHDPMDIDWNGIVDMQDFGMLLAGFGSAEHDLDGDGVVNGKDLGLMLVRMNTLVAVD